METVLAKQESGTQYMNKKSHDLQVAVYMITYNHKPFIKQSIESVMNQKTRFNFKLFIGDDNSTDGTKEICRTLAHKYGHKIDFVSNAVNLGASKNAVNIFDKCFHSGAKYIALLEGDDYWTDTSKLQKQVDFLEANPDFSLCFHAVQETIDNKEFIMMENPACVGKDVFTIYDLSKGNFIPTLSVIFRNDFKELPEWFHKLDIGDYPLYLLSAKHGKIKYLPDVMAVYRKHSGGLWSTQSSEKQVKQAIKVINLIKNDFKYDKQVYNDLEERAMDLYCNMAFNNFQKEKISAGTDILENASTHYPGIYTFFGEKYLQKLLTTIFSSRKYRMGKSISKQYQKIKSLVQGTKSW